MAASTPKPSSDNSSEQNGSPEETTNTKSYGTVNGHIASEPNASSQNENDGPGFHHDRGKARAFLAGCFWLEFLIWGLPFSYGIFQKYYSYHPDFSSESGIPAVGTTCMGTAYFLGPAVNHVLRQWPSQRRNVSIVGLILIPVSLVLASFATHVVHLILTQGLLYGIGGALLYNPFLFYTDEWFEKEKGLAYSVFWAGTGVSGGVVPFVMAWSLEKYGFRTVLRAWGILTLVCLGFLVYVLRPPRPLPKHGVKLQPNHDFLRSPLFWAFQAGNVIEGLGYFVPQVYLESFAKHINLSELAAISSISILNVSSTFGLILIGLLVDRYHISTVLMISALTSTLSVFLLWGFALNITILFLFSITFGIFAGGYVATWTGCALEVQKRLPDSDTAEILGWMAAGRGFGCVFCGPISEALLGIGARNAAGAYGTNFGALIIFTGITSMMGRFGLFGSFDLRAETSGTKRSRTNSGEHEPLVQ